MVMYFPLTGDVGSYIPDSGGISSDGIGKDQTDLVTRAVDDVVVDNENYYYIVYALFPNDHTDGLKAVRIKYSLP